MLLHDHATPGLVDKEIQLPLVFLDANAARCGNPSLAVVGADSPGLMPAPAATSQLAYATDKEAAEKLFQAMQQRRVA